MYALLFTDNGLSVAQVSTLFVLWSVTGFVLEVPSGALADMVDRRRLLVLSALVYAAGFASWVLWPSYAGFALGFVLWGVSGSLMSGTFESLVYDELDAHGRADAYPRLLGHAQALAMTANLVATVSAAQLFAAGGYALVGWVSVAVAGMHALLAATLPVTTHRRDRRGGDLHQVASAAEAVTASYLGMLRTGVTEAVRQLPVRRAVLLSAAIVGGSAYDEYFPLVARDHGVATATVPWLVGLVVIGQVVARISWRALSLAVVVNYQVSRQAHEPV